MALLIGLLLFLAALLRGAAPERLLTGALLFAALVEFACNLAWPVGDGRAGFMIYALADILLLGAIMSVALHANRLYPLGIGAAQIVTLTSHFAGAALSLTPEVYAFMQQVPFYLELGVMASGLVLHATRQRRGDEPRSSWSS
jgi:hypothetical protein